MKVLHGGLGRELDRALADVHRQVSDALEVGHHLERERNEAQVRGHGLALGQDQQTQLVGLHLELIYLVIVLDGATRENDVALHQCLDRVGDHGFDVTGM
jgi:hypothetical protein